MPCSVTSVFNCFCPSPHCSSSKGSHFSPGTLPPHPEKWCYILFLRSEASASSWMLSSPLLTHAWPIHILFAPMWEMTGTHEAKVPHITILRFIEVNLVPAHCPHPSSWDLIDWLRGQPEPQLDHAVSLPWKWERRLHKLKTCHGLASIPHLSTPHTPPSPPPRHMGRQRKPICSYKGECRRWRKERKEERQTTLAVMLLCPGFCQTPLCLSKKAPFCLNKHLGISDLSNYKNSNHKVPQFYKSDMAQSESLFPSELAPSRIPPFTLRWLQ